MVVGILAIDQGTSATKALVVDERGELLSVVQIDVALHALGDGGVQQDPNELLDSVLRAGRQAVLESGADVTTLGVANQGETVLAWDARSGSALSPAISWQDRRAAAVVEDLVSHAARLHEITGLPLDPYFSAPKLRWLSDRSPAGARVTTLDVWLNWHLSGRAVTDVATASRSLVLDLATRTWSREAAEIFGLAAEGLPEVVDNCGELATTDVFGPRMTLGALIVDQQAALWGEHCRDRGEGKCTYGTGAFYLLNCGDAPAWSQHGLSGSVAWQTPGSVAYCLDGQVYSAGSAVDWLVRTGLLSSSHEIDAVVEGVRERSEVLCVPSFAGLGAPRWEPRARAHFEGVDLSTSSADIVWSVIDGIACQVAGVVLASESDLRGALDVLRVDGGLTHCASLMQHQADVLQRPVEVGVAAHATSRGVADLAWLGVTGEHLGSPASTVTRYEPHRSSTWARERLARWDDAADRVGLSARRT